MNRRQSLILLSTAYLIFSMASSSAQAFASAEGGNGGATSSSDKSKGEIPQLPASSGVADVPVLKLGESMKFEHLGPVIINVDGTTRRIDNWDKLTEKEREVTWRRISKRNQQRIDALKAATETDEQDK